MTHPYRDAPDHRWWRTMAQCDVSEVDPIVDWPFRITKTDRVVAAGSCFAQQIAQHLRASGFTYLVTEPAHPLLPPDIAEAWQYGVYSARYGNIPTPRQLLQLLRRVYDLFVPREDVWEQRGRFIDPFRPTIQPDGFATKREYDADRQRHFAAVRQAFERMDVFVFTFGLTECWTSRIDGAVFTLCPGVVAGTFDPERHVFVNLSYSDVVADMTTFLSELREINPHVKVILTLSPVPLVVTAEDRHVLISQTLSHSVLRVAAEEVARLPGVAYFPAYEIATGAFTRGAYLDDDLRSVRPEGVEHIMRVFFRHVTDAPDAMDTTGATDITADERAERFSRQVTAIVDAVCDDNAFEEGARAITLEEIRR